MKQNISYRIEEGTQVPQSDYKFDCVNWDS